MSQMGTAEVESRPPKAPWCSPSFSVFLLMKCPVRVLRGVESQPSPSLQESGWDGGEGFQIEGIENGFLRH